MQGVLCKVLNEMRLERMKFEVLYDYKNFPLTWSVVVTNSVEDHQGWNYVFEKRFEDELMKSIQQVVSTQLNYQVVIKTHVGPLTILKEKKTFS